MFWQELIHRIIHSILTSFAIATISDYFKVINCKGVGIYGHGGAHEGIYWKLPLIYTLICCFEVAQFSLVWSQLIVWKKDLKIALLCNLYPFHLLSTLWTAFEWSMERVLTLSLVIEIPIRKVFIGIFVLSWFLNFYRWPISVM